MASSSQQVTFNRSHLTLEASSTQQVTSLFRSTLISCLKHRAQGTNHIHRWRVIETQQVTSDFAGVIDSTGHIPFPVNTDFLFETQGTGHESHSQVHVIATQQVTSDFGGVIDTTGHIPFPVTTDFLFETQGTGHESPSQVARHRDSTDLLRKVKSQSIP